MSKIEVHAYLNEQAELMFNMRDVSDMLNNHPNMTLVQLLANYPGVCMDQVAVGLMRAIITLNKELYEMRTELIERTLLIVEIDSPKT